MHLLNRPFSTNLRPSNQRQCHTSIRPNSKAAYPQLLLQALASKCTDACPTDVPVHRRAVIGALATIFATGASGQPVRATGIDVIEDAPGFGTRGARRGDLLLVHYVGRVESTGQVFDSTRGGLKYRDGGPGVFRPAVIALAGGPVPGICEGLKQAFEGMSIGGKRTVRVPAELGFGGQSALAPYGIVPGGSSLVYEVELLRLSAAGPDELTKGIFKCGAGGASQQAENCGNISYAEFL